MLLAAAIGFALHNDQPVSLNYYFGWSTLPLPLYLWVFLFFLIGLLLSGAASSVISWNLRARLRQQKKNLVAVEQKRQEIRRTEG